MKQLIKLLFLLLLVGCIADDLSTTEKAHPINGTYYAILDTVYREYIFTEDASIILVDRYGVTKSDQYILNDSIIINSRSGRIIGFYQEKKHKSIWIINDADTIKLRPIDSLLYLDVPLKSTDIYLSEQQMFREYLWRLKNIWESAQEDTLATLYINE